MELSVASKTEASSRQTLLAPIDIDSFDPAGTSDAAWVQALLDSVPDPVMYVDAGQVVRAVNDASCKLLARKSASLVGKHLNDVVVPYREPSGEPYDLAGAVVRSMAESGSREVGPFLIKKRVGKTDPVSVAIEPHGHKGREAVGCAVIVRANSPEESGEKLRDAILSLVSHELRTPLLHIKGFVSSLLQTDVEWDEETRLDFLQTIDHEADRLTSLVEDLLDISALQGGLLPVSLEKSDPYLLVHQGIDEASPYISRHKVVVDVPEDLPQVKVDNTRMVTVLVNLLQNAARHSDPGTTLRISAKTTDHAIEISVKDEGPGIPEHERQDIFDSFFRGKKRATRQGDKTSGTGLGLAVTRAAVEAHGGKIWVDSAVDSADEDGASFTFTIPVAHR
jgi:PAS domain S-box-containing protein